MKDCGHGPQMSTPLKSQGFSLIEVLVSLGIFIVGLLAFSSLSSNMREKVRKEKYMVLQQDYINFIEDQLAVGGTCSRLLQEAVKDLTISPSEAAEPGTENLLNVAAFNQVTNDLQNSIFSIKKAQLDTSEKIDPDPSKVETDQEGDRTNWEGSRTYKGTITFTLEFREERNRPFNYMLREIKIPITLFDHRGKNKWNEISCASLRSDEAFIIGQICNMYGGTLTDGIHCDMVRMIRKPNPSANNLLSQASNSRSQRVSLADAICYLDQLMILMPTRTQFSGVSRTTTRFCKRPGSVKIISTDVKKIFKEVGI